MASTKIDLMDARARLTREGWEYRRKAIVYNLNITEPVVSAHSRISAAYIELISDASRRCVIGDAHPDPQITDCYLEEVNPEAVDQDKVTFELLYKPPDANESVGEEAESVIEVGASVIQVETNKNAAGNVMSVQYGGSTQGGLVSKFVPQTTISVTRREFGSPGSKARNYVGKVNSSGWSLDPGAQARTWLCTSINGRSIGGGGYEVNYQFQYRDETWDETIVYMDPETGRPPNDVSDEEGINTYIVYQTTNFNNVLAG
jgi:hypothetical protein